MRSKTWAEKINFVSRTIIFATSSGFLGSAETWRVVHPEFLSVNSMVQTQTTSVAAVTLDLIFIRGVACMVMEVCTAEVPLPPIRQ